MRHQPQYEQQTGFGRSTSGPDAGLRNASTGDRTERDWLPDDSEAGDLAKERHYSVAELGKIWNLSQKTIRRMFENEPGVLQWGRGESRLRRGYVTIRIPRTVALRVHRRLRIAG